MLDCFVKSSPKKDSNDTNCILFLSQKYESKEIAKNIKEMDDKIERLKSIFEDSIKANFLWELQTLHDIIIRIKQKMTEKYPCFNDLVMHAYNIGYIQEPENCNLPSENIELKTKISNYK